MNRLPAGGHIEYTVNCVTLCLLYVCSSG